MLKITGKLFFILLVIMLIMVVNGLFVYSELHGLRENSYTINRAGLVRGTLQRAVKLELAGRDGEPMLREVDALLADFAHRRERGYGLESRSPDLTHRLAAIRHGVAELRILTQTYRRQADPAAREAVVRQSELLWLEADDMALALAALTEKEAGYFYILLVLLGVNLFLVVLMVLLIKYYVRDQLEYYANFDGLTGLLRGNAFENVCERERQRAIRFGTPLSLLVFDLDRFKEINDRYGHNAGDQVLASVGRTIREHIRRFDVAARLGGDEFAVLAPGSDLRQAADLAEKLRRTIQYLRYRDISVTVSVGVTQYRGGEEYIAMYKRADELLYQAKDGGRNRWQADEGESRPSSFLDNGG